MGHEWLIINDLLAYCFAIAISAVDATIVEPGRFGSVSVWAETIA